MKKNIPDWTDYCMAALLVASLGLLVVLWAVAFWQVVDWAFLPSH